MEKLWTWESKPVSAETLEKKEGGESMREDNDLLRKSVDAMARALALYHAIFAREAKAMLGKDQGDALVEKVVQQFGQERGRRIREEALSVGDELNLKALNAHYDLPLAYAWESEKQKNGSDVTFCPMADEWKRSGMAEEGKLYCAVDFAIAEGFSPDLHFSRSSSLMNGDSCCFHRYSEGLKK